MSSEITSESNEPRDKAQAPGGPWREGLSAGLVLGLADFLATGPWRVPLLLGVVVVVTPILGGLLAALLTRPLGKRGLAAALALFGAVALQGLSLVTKEYGPSPLPLFLVAVLASTTGTASLVSSRGTRGVTATLVALIAVPAGSLLSSLFEHGPLAMGLGLTLPLLALLLSRLAAARSKPALVATLGALLTACLPLPVLFLDGPPAVHVERSSAASRAPDSAPDVLLLVIDTLRADAVDWTPGNGHTPNLAAVAEHGVRFDQAISSASWTLPAMSSLFTGLLPSQHGATDRRHALPLDVSTLAERFHEGGYRTAAFTGGAFVDPTYGLAQGFEHFDAQAEYWFRPLRVHVPLAWRVAKNRFFPQRWALRLVHEFGGLRSIRANLEEWLEEPDTRPLFLLVHTYQVHDYYIYHPNPDDAVRAHQGPVPAVLGSRLTVHPEELLGLGPEVIAWFEKIYRARLKLVDREIGALLAQLREARGDRGMVLALTSDHGEGFDAELGRVHHGGRLHDDLLRVPLVLSSMRVEGALQAALGDARIIQQQVAQVDLAPTLVELLGLESLGEIAGSSLLPALKDAGAFTAEAWSEDHLAGPRWRSLRTSEWKLMESAEGRQGFDLGLDALESQPLPMEGIEVLQSIWEEFDRRYPARTRSEAEIDPTVQHQLNRIGYGEGADG